MKKVYKSKINPYSTSIISNFERMLCANRGKNKLIEPLDMLSLKAPEKTKAVLELEALRNCTMYNQDASNLVQTDGYGAIESEITTHHNLKESNLIEESKSNFDQSYNDGDVNTKRLIMFTIDRGVDQSTSRGKHRRNLTGVKEIDHSISFKSNTRYQNENTKEKINNFKKKSLHKRMNTINNSREIVDPNTKSTDRVKINPFFDDTKI